jgi:hypothetical protein
MRFHLGGLKYGFRNWSTKGENRNHVARYVCSVRRHLAKLSVKRAFNEWKIQMARDTCSGLNRRIQTKNHELSEVEHTIKVNKRLAQIGYDKLNQKFEVVNHKRQ